MIKLSTRVEKLLVQLGEEEAREKEKAKEAEVKVKEKELSSEEKDKEKDEEKEKKFSERFGKHFSEHSKGMHERMCALEEGNKSLGESLAKVVEMSEKYFDKK